VNQEPILQAELSKDSSLRPPMAVLFFTVSYEVCQAIYEGHMNPGLGLESMVLGWKFFTI
jgi:hypothetical protein